MCLVSQNLGTSLRQSLVNLEELFNVHWPSNEFNSIPASLAALTSSVSLGSVHSIVLSAVRSFLSSPSAGT